jgi:hypothetical protein
MGESMTNQQLYLAIGIPSILVILSWLSNRADINALRTELTNFRLEMTKELGTINVRLAIIETKMGLPTPIQKEKEQTAA